MVREVSVDSVIGHGEWEEVKSAPMMSVETAEFCVFPMSCIIGFQDVITWRNWIKCRQMLFSISSDSSTWPLL